MKGKSIITILGGIGLSLVAFSMFKNHDMLYGFATALIAVVLFYFGFKNRYKEPAYKNYDQSVNSHFNISGSGTLNRDDSENKD